MLPLSQSFKDSCHKFYQAEMEEVDFLKATEEARTHINSWVANKTEGENILLFYFNSILINFTVSFFRRTSNVNE